MMVPAILFLAGCTCMTICFATSFVAGAIWAADQNESNREYAHWANAAAIALAVSLALLALAAFTGGEAV